MRAGSAADKRKTAEFSDFRSCSCEPFASGRDAVADPLALIDDDIGRLIQALAALRDFAERSVNRVNITAMRPRGFAQFAVSDRIADTDVHRGAFSESRI